jgi:hypothetical protein
VTHNEDVHRRGGSDGDQAVAPHSPPPEGAAEGTTQPSPPAAVKVYVSPIGEDLAYARDIVTASFRRFERKALQVASGQPESVAGDGCFYGARCVVMVLRSRYHPGGSAGTADALSTVHREYRVAREHGLPVFVLLHRDLFEAWASFDAGQQPAADRTLLSFVSEIMGYDPELGTRNPFIRQFATVFELRAVIDELLHAFDDYAVVKQNPPLGRIAVGPGEVVEQGWYMMNTGFVCWTDRELRLLPGAPPAVTHALGSRSRIDEVESGDVLSVSVRFRAPHRPGEYDLRWGLYSAAGDRHVAWRPPLECRIVVS